MDWKGALSLIEMLFSEEKVRLDTPQFPQSFLWGCATSSFQVEGATGVDGRAPSVWDTFCQLPGRVANDHTGERGADQYSRYKEDVRLMRDLGMQAYRFSISWPRVFPEGTGTPNEKGWDYYNRLVDDLLENGIEPWVTIFHWDWPQALEDRYGGWRSREIIGDFAAYAGAVSKRLSDRVKHFFTINEFSNYTDRAYHRGEFAPGLRLSRRERNRIRHIALLAHGEAVAAVRASAKRAEVRVGIAQDVEVCIPVIERADHIEAASKATRRQDAHFLTAILESAYMAEYLEEEGADAPEFTDEEMKIIGRPLDFVGINAYIPRYARASDRPEGFEVVAHPAGYPRMSVPWLYFAPQIVYWAVRHLSEIWGTRSIYITENGCACDDRLTREGEVLDTDRVMFLRNYLISAKRAVDEGYPLHGYFAWSLLDNFEWVDGYAKRFGLVYVNFETMERTPKLSSKFYREVIKSRRVL